MIVKDEFLKKLRSSFNLNIYEAKIWTALLSRGIATAGELSDISGIPRSRSYDVLESLERRGFVIIKIGKPIKYIAVTPEEVIKRVKKGVVETTDHQIKLLDGIKETEVFKEMNLLYKQGVEHVEPANLSGAIKGRTNIYNHIENMIEDAHSYVYIMTTTDGFVRKSENMKRIFKKLADHKVKIRIAAPITTDAARRAADEIKSFVEIKNISRITSRFVIVDGKEVLFMMENDKDIHESYDTGIWVNTGYFANSLTRMFDLTWQTAA